MTFPRTKIQPPLPRPGVLIERPALQQRLAAALGRQRLVLLCAPAGFGKTSALARQTARLQGGTALGWIACDEGDSPAQLLECLIAALDPYDVPWRTAPEALIRAAAEATSPAGRRAVAVELINALHACDAAHGVIAIEDLHRIDNPLLFEFIEQLLERLPAHWTLAITSRQPPPFSLARLRAQGDVADFGPADLRFSAEEARELAAIGGLSGTALDAVDRLCERAQGWPAALRLALGALVGAQPASAGAPAGSGAAIDRHAIDFLTDEVIARLRPALRDFLLACSVLPELTPARCAALTGDAQAVLRLEEIERAGLFVSVLDGAETTLRLHDLFRDALQARLQREQPQRLPELLRRAAASEPDALRRVGWLQRAGDWRPAEELLSANADALVTSGQGLQMQAVLNRFPAAQRDASPRLQMVSALLGWVRWDWSAVIDATARALAAWQAAGDADAARSARSYHAIALAGANRPQARSVVEPMLADRQLHGPALCRALVAACWIDLRDGDQRRIAPQFSRMLDTLEPMDDLARWYECSPLPPFAGLPGMRAPLQRYIDGALRLLPEQPTPLRGMCLLTQGALHLWGGDVDAADDCIEAAASDARWLARPASVDSHARLLQSLLLALRGRPQALDSSRALLQEVQAAHRTRVRVYQVLYLFIEMRCAALLDDGAALSSAAERLLVAARHDRGWLSQQQIASAPAHIATVAGRLDDACAAWRRVLANEDHAELYGQVAEARLRLADLLWQRERPVAEAAAVLLPLFDRTDASGEWACSWMAGPAVLLRLSERDWAGTLAPSQLAALRHWACTGQALRDAPATATEAVAGGAAAQTAASAATPTSSPAARNALTPREFEVLARLAAGDANKLIARALDLSPHTVKRHVANILDKLGCDSRGQAAAWYHRHG